jgi:membrane protease YdiL (CAAX protease family)
MRPPSRRPRPEPRNLPGWGVTSLAVALVLYGNAIAFPPLPDWVVFLANLAVGAAVLRAAGAFGYSLPEVGLSPEAWRRGWRWGVGVGAVVVAVVAVLAGPAGRFDPDPAVASISRGVLAWQVLLRIPVGTALFEETMFRGVLYGAWRRARGPWPAAVLSSVAFALWHVVVELHRQERRGHAFGGGGLAAALPVFGFLFLAGIGFCRLRERSGGVIAPAIVHWAANGSATVAVYLVST